MDRKSRCVMVSATVMVSVFYRVAKGIPCLHLTSRVREAFRVRMLIGRSTTGKQSKAGSPMTRFSARFTRMLPLIAVAAVILTTLIAACEGGTVTVELPTVEVEPSDGGGGLTITTGGQSTTIAPSAGVTITLGDGTVARYLVQEQFANVDLPNDAIGETSDVTGTFAFSRDGEIVASGSRIVMNAANLRSDEPRRDNYLGDNAIETNTYPGDHLCRDGHQQA